MIKSFVLDTNTLLTSPYSLLSFDDNNVSITDVTLEELDAATKQGGERASNAREAIRILDELRGYGNLSAGVKLPGGGLFKVEINHISAELPASWNQHDPCNRILRVCKGLRDEGQSVVLVSTDISMRIKADLLRIPAEEYKTEQVDIPSRQYKGRRTVLCDANSIDLFFKDKKLEPESTYEEGHEGEPTVFTLNEFVLMRDYMNLSHTAIGRYDGKYIVPLVFKDEHPHGITPRNIGQFFALEALMMPTSKCSLCILKGPAGTAKTF